jgi:probable rRNA maturation factor
MIKFNVITKNTNWYKFIKNPNNYLDKKIKKLNSKNKILKKNNVYCTLLLSGEKEIKILNKKFRKKNKTTDVLSFPFYSKKELKKRLLADKEIYLGDIIINIEKINDNKNNTNFKIRFDNLWVHGLVHLFGYDHKKKLDYLEMNKIEKKYIKYINA